MVFTKGDLDKVRNILREELENQEEKYEAKLTEFKSDFFEKIDPILKEVTTAREERPLIIRRIKRVEKKLHLST